MPSEIMCSFNLYKYNSTHFVKYIKTSTYAYASGSVKLWNIKMQNNLYGYNSFSVIIFKKWLSKSLEGTMCQCAVGTSCHTPLEFTFVFMKSMNFCNNIIWMPPLFVAVLLWLISVLLTDSRADRSEIIRYSIFSCVAFTSSAITYALACMVRDAVGELVNVVIRRSMLTVVKLPSTSVGINSAITNIFFFADSEFGVFCASRWDNSAIIVVVNWK